MPITEIFIYEEHGTHFLTDKYGLSHLPFPSEIDRTIFISSLPDPKPKINKHKPDVITELERNRKTNPVIEIEDDSETESLGEEQDGTN